eukprot:13399435-Heterocapsa_arctica.AAC.1
MGVEPQTPHKLPALLGGPGLMAIAWSQARSPQTLAAIADKRATDITEDKFNKLSAIIEAAGKELGIDLSK